MPELQVLMSGLVFPESPRWHDDRLWLSDWGANEVIAINPEGKSEVIVRVQSFPMCIDRLPDGRLLIVSASDGLLLRREPDGSLVTHAELMAACRTLGFGPTFKAAPPTGSASTPKTRSGAGTSPTRAASAFAKAARCSDDPSRPRLLRLHARGR